MGSGDEGGSQDARGACEDGDQHRVGEFSVVAPDRVEFAQLVAEFAVCLDVFEGLERHFVGSGLRNRPPAKIRDAPLRLTSAVRLLPSAK